ncbi:hypothetical protein SAMN06265222_111168 [Neorhodopirellula lusitana]|uniref:Transposase n=1 Tax=Neorhodopirellula lusitana TaxID=445327 RepID=A0ABY1QGE0_9BACT|nr:hypothetical protein SAMN06265222_111168 [Neorhodopirellula lusitana]
MDDTNLPVFKRSSRLDLGIERLLGEFVDYNHRSNRAFIVNHWVGGTKRDRGQGKVLWPRLQRPFESSWFVLWEWGRVFQ